MEKAKTLTEGKIFGSLFRFALPVLLALFLQALYGGVDLLVVGQFAETADVSGVATGSMIMHTFTSIVTGLAMGITVLVARKIGEGNAEKAGHAVGSGICLFFLIAVVLTLIIVVGAEAISQIMQAPKEAFAQTTDYLRICGIGTIFIVAYNVLGSIFRGIGDSKTPLITVAIACVLNIAGDLLFVAVFGMGAAGAAWATVISQAVSVVASLFIIRRTELPFTFKIKHIRFNGKIIKMVLRIGVPVALQDLLVGISFLVIQMIVNSIDVVASAAVGVSEKVCIFLMLVPGAYMQAMSAFVAQNIGAQKLERANKALKYGILTSLAVGCIMSVGAIFYGDVLASLFVTDQNVIESAHSYLIAYGIDCLMTPFLFCFIGYYNGREKTLFVMIQGLIGAFCVRVPVVYLMSCLPNPSLFQIGLGTPVSTVVQIILCLGMFVVMKRKTKAAQNS